MRKSIRQRMQQGVVREEVSVAVYVLAIICTTLAVVASKEPAVPAFSQPASYCKVHPQACIQYLRIPTKPEPTRFNPDLRYRY